MPLHPTAVSHIISRRLPPFNPDIFFVIAFKFVPELAYEFLVLFVYRLDYEFIMGIRLHSTVVVECVQLRV